MHKNTVDIGNFTHTHTNPTHNEKAKQEKSWYKSLTNLLLVYVEAGTFLYSSLVETRSNQLPYNTLIGSDSPPSLHSTVEPASPIFNSPSKILPTSSLILKMATLPNGKATSSWLAFIKSSSISGFRSLLGSITNIL